MVDGRARRGLVERLVGWPLVAVLALSAFVLGFIGFETRLGTERSYLDIGYLALQLFTVESGNTAGPAPPVTLEIARFLAPTTTAYALGRALIQLFQARIDRWRLRRRRGHIVVVGLGWLGLELIQRLATQRLDVVAIESSLDDEAVSVLRRLKVPVVAGDARDPDVLREARVHAASHVVVLAGDDQTCAEVALTIRRIFHSDGIGRLLCHANISDPQLCRMLRTEALLGTWVEGFRLEFFNVAEETASIMLDEYAPLLHEPRSAHIGVVGENDVAGSIVSEAARVRRLHRLGPVHITLVGPGRLLPRLAARFPTLHASTEVRQLEDHLADAIADLAGCDAVFVCDDDDTRAIATSLELAERLGETPIVVALGPWTGIGEMLEVDTGPTRSIRPFLVYDRLLDADLLLAGLGERLAREVHASYVAERRSKEHDSSDPSLVDWRDLHEEYRESSRAQAAHLPEKLDRIGCGIAPLSDWDESPPDLTDAEVETLARLEHERWVSARKRAGWVWGKKRDPDRKTSPYLVAWEELTGPDGERVKDLDRDAARNVPNLLSRAGYRLVRRTTPGDICP